MSWKRLSIVIGVLSVFATTAHAQRSNGVEKAPRLLVTPPYTAVPQDSAFAVRLGDLLREQLDNSDIVDKWYSVIPKDTMGQALAASQYDAEALLSNEMSRQLATTMGAEAVIFGTLTRDANKRAVLEIRAYLQGVNTRTGYAVTIVQGPADADRSIIQKVFAALLPVFSATPDAKKCESLMDSDPKKAMDAANKALKTAPKLPLAEICIARLLEKKGAKPAELLTHFKNAAEGDPYSLVAQKGLLLQYTQMGDSAKMGEQLEKVAKADPTDTVFVYRAITYYNVTNQPKKAEQLAREFILIDDTDPRLFDLLANACVVQGRPECVVDVTEQLFKSNPKAKTEANYNRVLYVLSEDSTKVPLYTKWAEDAAKAFPQNGEILGRVAHAYLLNKNYEGLKKIGPDLAKLNPEGLAIILSAAQDLVEAKRYDDALGLAGVIKTSGSKDDKATLGGVIIKKGVLPIANDKNADSASLARAVQLAELGVGMVDSGSTTHQFGHYLRGLIIYRQMTTLDPQIVKAKSCDGVATLELMLAETKRSLNLGKAQSADVPEMLTYLDKDYTKRLTDMRSLYCKTAKKKK